MSRPTLACTMGDPAGIGPEIVLRALHEDPPDADVVLLGETGFWQRRARELEIDPDTVPTTRSCGVTCEEIVPGRPVSAAGAAALASLEAGVEMVESREADAMVTAPLNKHLVALHAPRFRGHTEWLAERADAREPTMLFAAPRQAGAAAGADIALLSTHLPLASAIALVRRERVGAMLVRIDRQWTEAFGRRPEIGLAALNPHAGEAGRLGSEESRVLAPAMQKAREDGVSVSGPWPADSVFLHPELDLILALYHDQGTIMAKRAPWPTVNVTLGLPYVRTSPDHGTAYDRAATGGADWKPMAAALHLAAEMARRERSADSTGDAPSAP